MDVEYDDILLLLFLFCCDIGCWVDDVDVNVNASVQHHDMVIITRVVVTDRRNGLEMREIIVEIDLQLNSVGEQHWSVNTVMKNKEFGMMTRCTIADTNNTSSNILGSIYSQIMDTNYLFAYPCKYLDRKLDTST